MNARQIALAVSAALFLTSCGIGKPTPQPTTYVVEPVMPTQQIGVQKVPDALRMGSVRMAAPFSGNSLVYRLDDVSYVSDPNQAFIADPGSMLGSKMATWLGHSGAFKSVSQPGINQSAPYVLESTVTELYGDFRQGTPPTAVVAVQFALIDVLSVRPRIVYERTIEQHEPLDAATPDALVRGYSRAVSQILTQFVTELSVQKPI